MLRDRLICGVNHPGIQRKLLSEGEISYDQALALAQSIETAEQDAEKLAGSTPPQTPTPLSQLHLTRKTSTSPSSLSFTLTCYRCGGPHLATHCRHKNTECRYCKKRGHLAKVCRSKARSESAGTTSTREENPPKQNLYVEETTDAEPVTNTEYDMHVVEEAHSAPYLLDLLLNDVPVTMELDTGAAVSVINESTFDNPSREQAEVIHRPGDSGAGHHTTQCKVQRQTPVLINTYGVWEWPQPTGKGMAYSP